jgi:uncharacterized protein (DUF2164 family)
MRNEPNTTSDHVLNELNDIELSLVQVAVLITFIQEHTPEHRDFSGMAAATAISVERLRDMSKRVSDVEKTVRELLDKAAA